MSEMAICAGLTFIACHWILIRLMWKNETRLVDEIVDSEETVCQQAEQIQQRDDSIKLYKATLVQNGLDMTGMRDENQRLKAQIEEIKDSLPDQWCQISEACQRAKGE